MASSLTCIGLAVSDAAELGELVASAHRLPASLLDPSEDTTREPRRTTASEAGPSRHE
jgi:hypothetical protein